MTLIFFSKEYDLLARNDLTSEKEVPLFPIRTIPHIEKERSQLSSRKFYDDKNGRQKESS